MVPTMTAEDFNMLNEFVNNHNLYDFTGDELVSDAIYD